jgi:hypothetical protein
LEKYPNGSLHGGYINFNAEAQTPPWHLMWAMCKEGLERNPQIFFEDEKPMRKQAANPGSVVCVYQ